MVDSMMINRRHVLGGALAAGGLLVSGCHTRDAGPSGGEPAVPFPEGDVLGIGLESYPYPHPVQYLDVTHVAQADWIDRRAPDWERRARLAYMDVAAGRPGFKGRCRAGARQKLLRRVLGGSYRDVAPRRFPGDRSRSDRLG